VPGDGDAVSYADDNTHAYAVDYADTHSDCYSDCNTNSHANINRYPDNNTDPDSDGYHYS